MTCIVSSATGPRAWVSSRYIVVSSHTSGYPNPIQFSKGDELNLGECDAEYIGWIRVTIADNNEGWAPESLIARTSSHTGTALSEYTARELDTHIGDIVSCIRELHGWLWVERNDGESGWVPKESVTPT